MKDFLAGFFSTLAAVGIIMLASCQHSYAQSPEQEFVQAVQKELNFNWAHPFDVYGEVTSTLGVTKCCGVILVNPSQYPAFDAEALRAARAVYSETSPKGIMFDVTFRRYIPQHVLEGISE